MKRIVISLMTVVILSSSAFAGSLEERIRALENALIRQEETIKKQQKIIQELSEVVRGQKSNQPSSVSNKPEKIIPEEAPQSGASRDYSLDDRAKGAVLQSGSPVKSYNLTEKKSPSLMNPAITLVLDTFYYNTNLSGGELEAREIPGYRPLREEEGHGHAHSETKDGFNLRSAELTFFAPVDPYFNLYSTIPVSEAGIELEEAYFVTTSLPAGLQVKGGKFKSGFGRFNAFHQHAWNFVDPPLPYLAFLGEEGLIEKGVQVTYLPEFPVYTLLGLEVLQGENEVLFGEEAKDGPHAYTAFAKASVDFGENSTVLFGASVADGKTKTESIEHESELSGDSTIYGAEFTYKWKPSKDKSFMTQGEYMLRRQRGDYIEDTTVPTAAERLERSQDGLYLQGLYQLGRWRVGARYDLLDVFENDFIQAGTSQDFGDDPYRITGSLEFNPTEFSRIRLQYNYDKTARGGKENNEVYLQFILGVGAHGAHTF